MSIKQTIGLFGLGTVGAGLFDVMHKGRTLDAEIRKICIRNPLKKRSLQYLSPVTDPDDILEDPMINLVVELIDDAEAAYGIVKKALLKGKNVVSGNKKMLAYHLDELISIQKENNTALLYDASACGSIPIIRNLEEYYDNDLLKSVTGILNGSCNYILTRLFRENISYAEALKQAQELGFAESDPNLDVEGYDSLFKLVIITLHSMGAYVHPDRVMRYGISGINAEDIRFAKEKGLKFKLTGQVFKLGEDKFSLFVLPRLVHADEYIYNVEFENNGVIIEGECYGKQFMFGKGAGAYPTGSAVLSDITALMYNYRYEYKKLNYFDRLEYTTDFLLEVYLRYNDARDLERFEFESFSEKFSGRDSNYVIGNIKLENLLKLKDVLQDLDIFLALSRR